MNVISVLSGHFDDRRRGNAGQAGEERIRYWRAENCRSRKRKTGEGGGSCSGTPTVRPVSITFPPSTFVKKPPVWISRMLQELTLNKNLLPSMNLCIETLNFMETGEMKFASCIFWLYVTVEKLFISYLYTAKQTIVAAWLLSGARLISGWTFIGVPGIRADGWQRNLTTAWIISRVTSVIFAVCLNLESRFICKVGQYSEMYVPKHAN